MTISNLPASRTAATAYDDVAYATHANVATHPDRLATIATLLGRAPAPVTQCRVLELGCGTGDNLIPMAATLRSATFVGCDLAGEPIAAGRRAAEALGLMNLTLVHADMRDLPAELGAFDYIIAHGVYSWVPEDVREAMLALIAQRLAPNGVAFVSYNAYPGCHVRRMAWDILRFHVEGIDDPKRRIAEARALIDLLGDPGNRAQPANAALRQELRDLSVRSDGALFHDDLSPINDPVWFHEFLAHAETHGLQFLGEAEYAMMADADIAPGVRTTLANMDRVSREQYLDFVRCRRFRQTLLCHAGIPPDTRVAPERLADMWALAPKLLTEHGITFPAPAPEAPVTAVASTAADVEIDEARAVLREIAQAWPRPVAIRQLGQAFRARTGASAGQEIPQQLCDILTAAYGAAAIELHLFVPPLDVEAGGRPTASPIIPVQLNAGTRVTNLWHESIDLDDPMSRKIVTLLDGTRDREALLAALGPSFGTSNGNSPAALLDRYLEHLARLALLIGD